jgi:hypothetical protein
MRPRVTSGKNYGANIVMSVETAVNSTGIVGKQMAVPPAVEMLLATSPRR